MRRRRSRRRLPVFIWHRAGEQQQQAHRQRRWESRDLTSTAGFSWEQRLQKQPSNNSTTPPIRFADSAAHDTARQLRTIWSRGLAAGHPVRGQGAGWGSDMSNCSHTKPGHPGVRGRLLTPCLWHTLPVPAQLFRLVSAPFRFAPQCLDFFPSGVDACFPRGLLRNLVQVCFPLEGCSGRNEVVKATSVRRAKVFDFSQRSVRKFLRHRRTNRAVAF